MKAIFEFWDAVWPTVAIGWLILMAVLIALMLRELWRVCVAERECEDCRIDEQCGHDWKPEEHIKDEIE